MNSSFDSRGVSAGKGMALNSHFGSPVEGGGDTHWFSDGVRGCSKVYGCFSSLIIGISMGGFPLKTLCAQFAKLGVFQEIR